MAACKQSMNDLVAINCAYRGKSVEAIFLAFTACCMVFSPCGHFLDSAGAAAGAEAGIYEKNLVKVALHRMFGPSSKGCASWCTCRHASVLQAGITSQTHELAPDLVFLEGFFDRPMLLALQPGHFPGAPIKSTKLLSDRRGR